MKQLLLAHMVQVSFAAVGDLEFSEEILGRIKQIASAAGPRYGATVVETISLTDKLVCFSFHNVPFSKAAELKSEIRLNLVMLVEHGPNADILDTILKKYPELQIHPRLKDVVGAFENLNGVLSEVLGDKSNRTVAELARRAASESPTVDVADLEAQGRIRTGMDQLDRAAFRDQARLGQTAEQQTGSTSKPDKPVIPPIYDRVAKQAKSKDLEASGDHGNVFGNA